MSGARLVDGRVVCTPVRMSRARFMRLPAERRMLSPDGAHAKAAQVYGSVLIWLPVLFTDRVRALDDAAHSQRLEGGDS